MPPERSAKTYPSGITSASKAVLLEVATTLRAYRDALVLIGGWVPYLLLQKHRLLEKPFDHVGSIDIDLAVDSEKIEESLSVSGCSQNGNFPSRFEGQQFFNLRRYVSNVIH